LIEGDEREGNPPGMKERKRVKAKGEEERALMLMARLP